MSSQIQINKKNIKTNLMGRLFRQQASKTLVRNDCGLENAMNSPNESIVCYSRTPSPKPGRTRQFNDDDCEIFESIDYKNSPTYKHVRNCERFFGLNKTNKVFCDFELQKESEISDFRLNPQHYVVDFTDGSIYRCRAPIEEYGVVISHRFISMDFDYSFNTPNSELEFSGHLTDDLFVATSFYERYVELVEFNQSCRSVQSEDKEYSNEATCDLEPQSLTIDFSAYKQYLNVGNLTDDYSVKLLEDLFCLGVDIIRSNRRSDFLFACIRFVKLRSSTSLIRSTILQDIVAYFSNLFDCKLTSDENFQLQDDFSLDFSTLRDLLDKYTEIKHSELFKKLYRFLMYCLSLSLFEKVGVSFDTFRYSRLEAEALRCKYHMGPDFIHSLLDTLLFLCERGYQCLRTGRLDPLYHSGKEYEEWFNKTRELIDKSKYLSNPEPIGFTRYEFISDLKDLMNKGTAMQQHANDLSNFHKTLLNKQMSALSIIKSNELTERSAQQTRKAPFAVLLSGGSGVAKSTLADLLDYQYGKLFDLPLGAEYKYTRNSIDPFWVNFNSSQWCLRLDDVAFMRPDAAPTGDPSLMEMIQVINNVPLVPRQAALDDKGKTPVLCRFVSGTTNTEHLNAFSYFSCPLAAQRRFPFVVEVLPKDEYLKDGYMIDSSKLPEVAEGEYPDFWRLIVKRVIPKNSKQATFEIVETFTDINLFVSWFSKEALKHEETQEKALKCNGVMREVSLCETCHAPSCVCNIQSDDECIVDSPTVEVECKNLAYALFVNILLYFCSYHGTRLFISEFVIPCIRFFKLRIVRFFLSKVLFKRFDRFFSFDYSGFVLKHKTIAKNYFNDMGEKINEKIGKHEKLVGMILFVTAALSSYVLFSKLYKLMGIIKDDKPVQSKSEHIGTVPKSGEKERVNVWYKNDYQTTTFDVSSQSTSLSQMESPEVVKYFEKNVVQFRFKVSTGFKNTKATCIGGHYYIFNKHAIPDDQQLQLIVIQDNISSGVNTSITLNINRDEVVQLPGKDLCLLEIRSIPPKKNIVKYFCKSTLEGGHKGFYLNRTKLGEVTVKNVHNIKRQDNVHLMRLGGVEDLWWGKVNEPTQPGDCGSLLISLSDFGPIILGIHIVGKDETVGSLVVTDADIEELIGNEPFIQSDEPLLNSENTHRELGDLSIKSPIRYLESGTAAVYGSFKGYRPKHKSNVRPTLIHDSIVKAGYKVNHGAPVMSGYEPWRIALKSMVDPVTKMDNIILRECVENFTNDILSSLPAEELRKVHVYDDVTAINGAVGVTYVDKINRSTSAGLPWRKSKKHFLTAIAPINGLMDPVEVDDEIMNRVDKCIERYEEGKRYCPNFCAHLKDEPTVFRKIDAKKTRVFTGAPFDWSIVVRKYLLSTIRIIQGNRFIFESAPGTIAQSTEWQDIYKYLVAHGKDRIVAGDYAAFDKRMSSTMIYAAFDVLINICKKAGYTDKELLVVKGIAADTAFPLVDFNGDLIQFYGSNPSGHPLTVIINGLANSLYMRYCYAVLSKDGNCKNFKKDVNLMTYGDDNIMGVNPKCEFFHHTSIQEVLADVNVQYTMADKEAASVPFIHIRDGNFLKRTWRKDEDVGAYLCPLEHDSIAKMLTICVKSKSITLEEQSIAAMSTALREYFFYGREVYIEKRELLQQIAEENDLRHYIEDSTFPTWEELKDQFWESSNSLH